MHVHNKPNRIREWRKNVASITLGKLSIDADIPMTTLSLLESQGGNPTLKTMLAICNYAKCSLDDLFNVKAKGLNDLEAQIIYSLRAENRELLSQLEKYKKISNLINECRQVMVED